MDIFPESQFLPIALLFSWEVHQKFIWLGYDERSSAFVRVASKQRFLRHLLAGEKVVKTNLIERHGFTAPSPFI